MLSNLPEPPNYEKKYKEAVKREIENVRPLVEDNDRSMRVKIENFCEKFEQDYEIIRQKILDDSIFALCFIKEPGRQKFHENIAADYIRELPFVYNFKDSGTDAKVVSNGAVLPKKSLRSVGGQSSAKSIDFTWEYEDMQFYAYHKYTKQSGGSQDNQYEDLKKFLEEANKSMSAEMYFIAIADGDYYLANEPAQKITKLQNLKDMANQARNVYAMPINELADFLIDICRINN